MGCQRNVLGCLLGSQKLPAGQRPGSSQAGSSGLDARGHASQSSQKIVFWVQGPQGPPILDLPVGAGGACWRTHGGTGGRGVLHDVPMPRLGESATSCPVRPRSPLVNATRQPSIASVPCTPSVQVPFLVSKRDTGAQGRCVSPLNTRKVMNISSPNCQNNCFIYRAELLRGASQ